MNHSTGKPTKYEAERIKAMLKLGCAALAQLGIWHIAEVHHIVEGNRRLGHWYTLPLSAAAHRGIWTPELIELVPPDMRVSISSGSKAFEKVYGTQKQLWMKVQERLRLPAVWPSSKILPRSGYVQVHTGEVSGVALSGESEAGAIDAEGSAQAATGVAS